LRQFCASGLLSRADAGGLERTQAPERPKGVLRTRFWFYKRDAPDKNRTCARGLGNRCSIH